MLSEELVDLVRKTQELNAEQQTIEVKSANKGCPKRLYDTLSSFSNQDRGGTIIFGLDEEQGFKTVGVYDVQDLQKHVTEQAQQMTPEINPLFTIAKADEKIVVSAEIPAMDITDRPCFYNGRGRLKGSFKRVGDGDYPMSEYEIYSYEAFRKNYHDEVRTLSCGMESLAPSSLANYLLRLKASKPHLASLDDDQICNLMSITKQGKVTLASELLLGLYPQAYTPQLCITAVRVYGKEKGELGPQGNRFEDNQRIEGTIPEMLEGCLSFLKRNLSISTKIDPETGERVDIGDLPMVALREVILNALIHRDYSVYTEGTPIQVELFSDRLEVRNPGGLYGRISINELGYVQGTTRNPVLATAAETLGITENRYSGIPSIRRYMEKAGKPQPEFIDKGTEFLTILRIENNTDIGNEDQGVTFNNKALSSKEQLVIAYCSTPKSRREIALKLGIGEDYMMRKYVNPLLKKGKLKRTIPDRPRSRNQKYIAGE